MFSKDKEIVGSGEPVGSVRHELIAVSGTMTTSVQNYDTARSFSRTFDDARREKLSQSEKS